MASHTDRGKLGAAGGKKGADYGARGEIKRAPITKTLFKKINSKVKVTRSNAKKAKKKKANKKKKKKQQTLAAFGFFKPKPRPGDN